jgi:ketosteroid isomerase-like protein
MQTQATLALIERFDAAFSSGDLDAVMAMITDDCVFENTAPPDGTRYEGAAAVRAAWEDLFRTTRNPVFRKEETFACGERCVTRWVFCWDHADGTRGHVRGVDVWRVRDGKVAELRAYAKG